MTHLALFAAAATLALAVCAYAVRHLDPVAALSAPRRTRARFRWHLRHDGPVLVLAGLATAALLISAFLVG
jgi:hypothetical protein